MDDSINDKIIKEIKYFDTSREVKDFLEEILLDEHAGVVPHAYKDYYKSKIEKHTRVEKKD